MIKKLLTDAYRQLGVTDKKENARLVKAAVDYLDKDREHYIELAEADQPDLPVHSGSSSGRRRLDL